MLSLLSSLLLVLLFLLMPFSLSSLSLSGSHTIFIKFEINNSIYHHFVYDSAVYTTTIYCHIIVLFINMLSNIQQQKKAFWFFLLNMTAKKKNEPIPGNIIIVIHPRIHNIMFFKLLLLGRFHQNHWICVQILNTQIQRICTLHISMSELKF